MPIAVEYDSSTRIMTYRVREYPGLDLMAEAVEARLAHPDYAEGIHVVWDLRGADFSALDSTTLRGLVAEAARRLQSEPKENRLAVIAPGDVEYGMARVYKARTGSHVRIFRTDRGVESWLLHSEDHDSGL